MATPGKLSKQGGKRQIPAKTSLNSPFNPQWSPLPQGDMHYILTTLKNKLASIGLEKKEVKVFRQWRKKKDKKLYAAEESIPLTSQECTQAQDLPRNGWTDTAARRQLAIGINEVTKALERNDLKLVLVCKSVKPQHMTNHLIALSATRQVPACQVPRLSESVSEQLRLKSVLALGFRCCGLQGDEIFADTVDAILPRVPLLSVAWIADPEARGTSKEPVEMKEEACEKRGQKRKLEVESTEMIETGSCTLQPLKVKKIIPNPSKKRIRKKKKASVKGKSTRMFCLP